jgi:hypothetical protein
MGEILAGADAGAVHELDRHRQDARLDDVGDAGARHLVRGKPHQHRPRALGLGQDAQRGLGHHAQLPFGPADTPSRSSPPASIHGPPRVDHGAVHQHQRDAQQVVRRHPVFQAMRPARVHRDVARNGAGQLAGGVGGIEEPVRLDRARHAQVGAPRLHPDEAVGVVGLQHPFIRATPRMTLSAVGSAPPASEVPDPRGTTGTPSSWHSRSTARPRRSCAAARRPAAGSDRPSARRIHRPAVSAGRRSPHRPAGRRSRATIRALRARIRHRYRHVHGNPSLLVNKYNQFLPLTSENPRP